MLATTDTENLQYGRTELQYLSDTEFMNLAVVGDLLFRSIKLYGHEHYQEACGIVIIDLPLDDFVMNVIVETFTNIKFIRSVKHPLCIH